MLAKMGDEIKKLFATMASLASKARIGPFIWNPESNSIHHIFKIEGGDDIPKVRIQFRLQLILNKIFLFCLICQEVNSELRKLSSATTTKIINWFAILTLTAYNVCLHVCNSKTYEIVKFTTELFSFLEKHKFNSNSGNLQQSFMKEKLAKYFGLLAKFAIVVIPAGYVFGLHWQHPEEKVSLVGNWLMGYLETTSGIGMILKIIVFLVNYLPWQANVVAAAFCICGIQMVCTILLIDCLQTFWKLESDNVKPFSERTVIYRELQLIGTLQTDVQAGALMSMIILIATFDIAISSSMVVRLPWNQENIIMILLFAYIALGCVLGVLVILGGHAQVWEESKNMFRNLDRLLVKRRMLGMRYSRTEYKWQKRFWLSCRNFIKVKFGVHNFVENETPLNCLNCAIGMGVQILLTKA